MHATCRALRFVLLVAGCLALMTGLHRAQESGVWTEHLLTTVPRGLSPTSTAWDSWISLTPDLSALAYAVRFRSGSSWRQSVVIGERREPDYDFASRPVVSPDGRHVAYIAVIASDNSLPAFLIIDGARLQIQYADRRLGPDWIPQFSPDSTKLAFLAERPGGKYAVGLMSLPAVAAQMPEVQWGPEFDAIDRPKWAPDSASVAYAAARSQSEWVAMRGADEVASYADISYVEFAPDGTLAFRASDGRKQFIVLGSDAQPAFDWTTAPMFQPNGTLVYTASDAGQQFAVVGSSRISLPHAAEGAAASADGTRVTHWYREDRRSGKHRLVVNGVPGPDFVRVSRPSIHAESGRFAYTAEDERGFFVVTSRGRSSRYDGVLWNPQINDEGTLTAYAALKGHELWWKVDRLD